MQHGNRQGQTKIFITNKTTAPTLNALIKIHKDNEPIRPEINNIQAPSYRLAKHFNKKLNQMIHLPYTYGTRNSKEVAQDLHNIEIRNQLKILTLDIKDLYVNLPIQNIVNITKCLLHKHNNQHIIFTQTLELIKTILHEKYFQYNDNYYQSIKGIALGSPLSSTLAEIYLQYFEELTVKHWMETNEIVYYKRYFVDITIIFNQYKTTEHTITKYMNNVHKHLEFKTTEEENNTIN